MELTKIKEQLESKSLEEINLIYANVISESDYKIITKIVRYIGYNSLADLVLKNIDDFIEYNKNPGHYYKMKLSKDIDDVFARCRNNWNFINFYPMIKASYVKKHFSVFQRFIGISFSNVLYEHKNVDGAKFIMDTLTTTKSLIKAQGATPPESDLILLEGVAELYEGHSQRFVSNMDAQSENETNQFIRINGNPEEDFSSKSDTSERINVNFIVNQYNFNEINNHTEINHNNTEVNHNHFSIQEELGTIKTPFPLNGNIELFNLLCEKLYAYGLISSLELFKKPFIEKLVENGERCIWQADDIALLFLITILDKKKQINAPNNSAISINESFLRKNGNPFNTDSLNSNKHNNQLGKLSSNNIAIQQYVSESKNTDIKTVYNILLSIYPNEFRV